MHKLFGFPMENETYPRETNFNPKTSDLRSRSPNPDPDLTPVLDILVFPLLEHNNQHAFLS